MGTSDSSTNGSAISVELYSSEYVSWYWGYGDNLDNVYTIQGLAQPIDVDAMDLGYLLEALDGRYTSVPSMDIPLGSCADNTSQATGGFPGNCSQACFDNTTLYLPWNLEACLNLGVTSMLIQDGSVVLDDTDDYTNAALRSHSIGNLSTWDGASVVQNIVQCAVSACTSNNVADCPETMSSLDGVTVNAANLQAVYNGLFDFCDNVGTTVNSDIAGPGVMFSYLVQICAATIFWVLARILTSWTRIILWPFLLCCTRPPPSTDPLLAQESEPKVPGRIKSAWLRATAIQKKLARLRLHAVTTTTLVEFQEIQAFFVGAIQIATLATFKPTLSAQSDAANTATFGEAINDSQLVQILCINGTLPVLLVQCILQRYGMRWWYTFTLVMVVFILALVVKARSNYFVAEFDDLWKIFVESKPVADCGGMTNPQVYCDTESTVFASSAGIYGAYFTVPVLIVDFLAPSVLRLASVRAILNTCWSKSRVFRWLGAKVWVPFLKTFWFFVELITLYFVMYYFLQILDLFGEMTSEGSLGTWSFGQLIAVTVWVPPILKFVFFNIVGLEEGLGRRLAHDYKVVHEQRPVEHSAADMELGFVELDDLQQGHEGPKHSPYTSSDAGTITPSMRMGSYDHLIQSPPEPYSSDYKSPWSRKWPRL